MVKPNEKPKMDFGNFQSNYLIRLGKEIAMERSIPTTVVENTTILKDENILTNENILSDSNIL